MALNYRLVVLTHGSSDTLDETLKSFYEMVTPAPTSIAEHADGEGAIKRDLFTDTIPRADLRFSRAVPAVGFCRSVQRAWQMAIEVHERRTDYVFWLEHDFRLVRPLDLHQLAAVLDDNMMIAQMSLMRDAVNEQEKAAGGVFEAHAGDYKQKWHLPAPVGDTFKESLIDTTPDSMLPWLEHRICLTTNPSLMRTDFMRRNPWPDYPRECEGHFSEDLRQRGYKFGTWGAGEVWVEHTGSLRTGFGY